MEAKKKVDEICEFVKGTDIHTSIKNLVTGIKPILSADERERKTLRVRAETAEKALSETTRKVTAEAKQTPTKRPNTCSDKRNRETPGEQKEMKKSKNDERKGSGRRTVQEETEKKADKKKHNEKNNED